MQPCLPRFVTFFILACIIQTTRCVKAPPSAPQDQLPAGSDFVLTHPRFEQRQGGHTLWKGRGAQAQGDIGHLAVQTLDLERIAQSPNEIPWTLSSPDTNMDFEAGTGRFKPVRLTNRSGHIITASTGHYREAAGCIDLAAPIDLTSPTLDAHATSAHIDFRTQRVDLVGPVEGTLWRAPPTELGP